VRTFLRRIGWYLVSVFLVYCILVGTYGGISSDLRYYEADWRVVFVTLPIIAFAWPVWVFLMVALCIFLCRCFIGRRYR